jgi:hypothetical protein
MSHAENIINAVKSLVKIDYSLSDPSNPESNMSLSFQIQGLVENKGTKKNPVIGDVEISKRSVNQAFEKIAILLDMEDKTSSHSGRLEMLGQYPQDRLHKLVVGAYDPKTKEYKNGFLGSGILSIVSSTLAEVNEVQDRENFIPEPAEVDLAFRTMLTVMSDAVEKYGKAESQADPFLDCKRRFLKCGIYSFINVAENPSELVQGDIDLEIKRLQDLREKASSISKEDYLKFLEEKKAANGLDEDGYVLARGKKKEESK